jgi:hypothetical protein
MHNGLGVVAQVLVESNNAKRQHSDKVTSALNPLLEALAARTKADARKAEAEARKMELENQAREAALKGTFPLLPPANFQPFNAPQHSGGPLYDAAYTEV